MMSSFQEVPSRKNARPGKAQNLEDCCFFFLRSLTLICKDLQSDSFSCFLCFKHGYDSIFVPFWIFFGTKKFPFKHKFPKVRSLDLRLASQFMDPAVS